MSKYIIEYTNRLEFENRTLSFRKKELFDITGMPIHIKRSEQGWWIGRKLLSPAKAKELTKNDKVSKDVTDLQWYDQEHLNHVFNL